MNISPVNLDAEVYKALARNICNRSIFSILINSIDLCFENHMVSDRKSKCQIRIVKAEPENVSVMRDFNLLQKLRTDVFPISF